MSRIGKRPIKIPKGVEVTLQDRKLAAKGPKGRLEMDIHPLVDVTEEEGEILCKRRGDSRKSRAAHGLVRALAANIVHGVSEGFERKLEINGVGYRAEVKGNTLVLQLGYSHPIEHELPEGITASVDRNIITLAGIDKEQLGAAAAEVRALRPPEPYKGKGVKYVEERILRKVGKAAG